MMLNKTKIKNETIKGNKVKIVTLLIANLYYRFTTTKCRIIQSKIKRLVEPLDGFFFLNLVFVLKNIN